MGHIGGRGKNFEELVLQSIDILKQSNMQEISLPSDPFYILSFSTNFQININFIEL